MKYAWFALLAAGITGATAAPTATSTARLPTVEMLRDEACACTTPECGSRVATQLARERRRFEETLEAGEECLSQRGLDEGVGMVLRKLEEIRIAVCECADAACIEDVKKGAIDWAMKNMEVLQRLEERASEAQHERLDRVNEEIRRCTEVITGVKREEQGP